MKLNKVLRIVQKPEWKSQSTQNPLFEPVLLKQMKDKSPLAKSQF